jgi:undecaprenyl diphosphate synthase
VDYKELSLQLDKKLMPRHVAIIMDGNGRWAKQRHKSRLFGHQQGARTLHNVVEAAANIKLEYLTIYAFSTENWRRPEDEVKGLMTLLRETLIREIDDLNKNNIVVRFLGSRSQVSNDFWKRLDATCEKTWKNTGMQFNIAFNYGGKQELLEAMTHIVNDIKNGREYALPLTENDINQYLYTAGMPDPDLVIRTSGEQRLSNFLIWQAAYSELWFTDTLWPDFSPEELLTAMLEFQKRNRRYGAL